MKIFISWSGIKSKEVAEYLRTWIEQIIQADEPWISVEIEKGKKELLDFYAEKYAKMKTGIEYDEVGNAKYIDDFMKYIYDNPLLLKYFGGREKLKSYITYKYDDGLPF